MSDQGTREALFELWERFGTCIESDSSEGWEMVDAILSRFNVTPKDEPRSTVVTDAMAQRAGAAIFDRLGPQIANAREWTEHGRAALEAALGVADA